MPTGQFLVRVFVEPGLVLLVVLDDKGHMKSDQLKQILNSLPTPRVPTGLESRVLATVHLEQQREMLRSYRVRWGGLLGISTTLLGSLLFLVYRLIETGTPVVIETLLMNQDVLSAQVSIYALLESLPIGSIALTLLAMAGLCFWLSIRKTKQQINFHTLMNPIYI